MTYEDFTAFTTVDLEGNLISTETFRANFTETSHRTIGADGGAFVPEEIADKILAISRQKENEEKQMEQRNPIYEYLEDGKCNCMGTDIDFPDKQIDINNNSKSYSLTIPDDNIVGLCITGNINGTPIIGNRINVSANAPKLKSIFTIIIKDAIMEGLPIIGNCYWLNFTLLLKNLSSPYNKYIVTYQDTFFEGMSKSVIVPGLNEPVLFLNFDITSVFNPNLLGPYITNNSIIDKRVLEIQEEI